jgi:hypothetical protein
MPLAPAASVPSAGPADARQQEVAAHVPILTGGDILAAEDRTVSLFYLLPHRAALGDRLTDALTGLLPGVDWSAADRARLAELLLDALADRPDVYFVCREDLPAGEPAERALVDGYGAAPGDEVIEVRPAARAGEFASRRWRVSAARHDPAA